MSRRLDRIAGQRSVNGRACGSLVLSGQSVRFKFLNFDYLLTSVEHRNLRMEKAEYRAGEKYILIMG